MLISQTKFFHIFVEVKTVQSYIVMFCFFTTKKRAHPVPYYLQGLSDKLRNILLPTISKIESHPQPKGFKFLKKMRGFTLPMSPFFAFIKFSDNIDLFTMSKTPTLVNLPPYCGDVMHADASTRIGSEGQLTEQITSTWSLEEYFTSIAPYVAMWFVTNFDAFMLYS